MGRRQRVVPTDDWQQLRLLARWPEQLAYELIRPVVLFGHSPAERVAETGAAERTLYRQVDRFEQLGMASFVPPPKVENLRTLSAEVRQAILNLMRDLLQEADYNVTTTNFVPATFAQIAVAQPDVLIVDLAMGHSAGWDLLEALHAAAATAGLPVIVVSTEADYLEHARALAARYGALVLLGKPFALDEMLALIAAALKRD